MIRAIVDITKNFPAVEQEAVGAVKRLIADARLPVERVTVFIRGHQANLVSDGLPGVQQMVVASPALVPGQALSMVQGDKDSTAIVVVSYSGAVLKLEKEDQRVRSLTFRRIRAGEAARLFEAAPTPSAPEPKIAPATMPAAAETCQTANVQHRSRLMGDALKKRKLGPFSKHRLAVYAALDQVMQSTQNLTVADLLDAAVARAKADWTAEPETTAADGSTKQDLWPVVRKFIEQVLTGAEVLLTAEGTPIGRDWSTAFSPVAKLASNWQAAADGQLVLGILEDFQDVTPADVKNLARVLCYTADSASQKRAQEAVSYLMREDLVEQAADGSLRKKAAGAVTQEPERLRVVQR